MKILLDTCVCGGAKAERAAAGHDVVWVGDWDNDPGDEQILKLAAHEERILVTLDKDFGELAIIHAIPHCGIVRLVAIRSIYQARICHTVLSRYADELQRGALVTVEPGRVRIRPAD